jgi:ATP-dependent RNA helicase SUPV3L1/SUV3
LEGFRFKVDPSTHHADHKLLFAAAEKHLPQIFADRARELAEGLPTGAVALRIADGKVLLGNEVLARVEVERSRPLSPRLILERTLEAVPEIERKLLKSRLDEWLQAWMQPLAGLIALDTAAREESGGPELRALLIKLIDNGGILLRARSGLDGLTKDQRQKLRGLKVYFGSLEVYVHAMLKPAAQARWRELCAARGWNLPTEPEGMPSVIAATKERPPIAYRRAGHQAIRVDLAERLFRAAHSLRVPAGRKPFAIDEALGRSMGLTEENLESLLRSGGFRPRSRRKLKDGEFGPEAPKTWTWFPPRFDEADKAPPRDRTKPGGKHTSGNAARKGDGENKGKSKGKPPGRADERTAPAKSRPSPAPAGGGAFAGLADLMRLAAKD